MYTPVKSVSIPSGNTTKYGHSRGLNTYTWHCICFVSRHRGYIDIPAYPAHEAAYQIIKAGALRQSEAFYPWYTFYYTLFRDWFPYYRDQVIRKMYNYQPWVGADDRVHAEFMECSFGALNKQEQHFMMKKVGWYILFETTAGSSAAKFRISKSLSTVITLEITIIMFLPF